VIKWPTVAKHFKLDTQNRKKGETHSARTKVLQCIWVFSNVTAERKALQRGVSSVDP
jgi:hypothetical protein